MSADTATPMLQQYRQIKSRHQDCILFFRLGDFYEMFYEDAKEASRILDLVLTARGKGTANHVPMCGIPFHSADSYIAKLIKSGKKVAICEQTEDPATAKGIVKRDVIRVISSGTFLDEHSSDSRYVLCLAPEQEAVGVSFIDSAAGTIRANQYQSLEHCTEIIARLPVFECVYPLRSEEMIRNLRNHPLLKTRAITFSPHEDWCFNTEIAQKTLCEHFHLPNLRGFGIQDLPLAISSTGALLEYLRQMNRQPLKHIDRISLFNDDDFAYISPAAISGLEIPNLFKTINFTQSALGKRKLNFWLYHPLKKPAEILKRQAAVTLLRDEHGIQDALRAALSALPDIEKSVSKLSCGYTNARDILQVRNALCLIPQLQKAVEPLAKKNSLFEVHDIPELRRLLENAINPDMPLSKHDGKVVRRGFSAELDELKDLQENGRQWLQNFQAREIERTGINSLKVGFNNVFGYYIEITRANLAHAPENYIRKQTLVNAERFITQELKDYEEKILTAQDKVLALELEILIKLKNEVLRHSQNLHSFAQQAARLDAIFSLTQLAQQPGYIAPDITSGPVIDIKEGRHPVVERSIDSAFVANDTYLDQSEQHLVILTGPNMAGKSTYIRQIAILTILAQIGSYIPAQQAHIGTVDKIFTRIGAHDDIARGQSTFMVEMNEMADILNNLTDQSLVILDEVGRGTSTFDGLSLAWALAEYLQKTNARVLFATHFHELTAMAEKYGGVKNYNVAVKEWQDEVVFLHKIIPGSSDDSYGIYVAKLAGVPLAVISRAKTILTQLELKQNIKASLIEHGENSAQEEEQLDLFALNSDPVAAEIRQEIERLDLNTLTPLEALNKIHEFKNKIRKN
ncbi:MAG TPA: DNA mismatch repair protein MutS [Candidatus Omnitrophota bacterium]|nr:DNA mismatch repair protein MutS [Candidatus Omnitrophota bacterium]